MKKKPGTIYYAINQEHLCECIDEHTFRDLTTNEEFKDDGDGIRTLRPEDLLDTTIVIEMTKNNFDHYIRVSYREIVKSHKINDFVSADLDSDGKLVGVRLNYPY